MNRLFTRKRVVAVFAAAAVMISALVIAGCGQQKAAKGPIPIKIGYSPAVCNASLFVAYEKGFFEEEGIDETNYREYDLPGLEEAGSYQDIAYHAMSCFLHNPELLYMEDG